MSVEKVDGIVIKEVNIKESDKMITVFSKELGKLQFYVKRARDIKSPFLAASQLLSFNTFIYNTKGDIKFLNQVNQIESFERIRFDINKLYYAMYFLEFLDKTTEIESPQEEELEFLIRTLMKLDKSDYDMQLLRCIYELRMLSILGYTPQVENCMVCDEEVQQDYCYFNIDECGILCEKCVQKTDRVIKIIKATTYTMKYIISSELSKIFAFNVSPQVQKELRMVTDELINTNICQKFKTLDFLKNV